VAKQSTKAAGRIPSLLAGVAGEYFVAAELSRREYIASISLRNTPIQCKTNQVGRKTWLLNEKCEMFRSDNHYYAFVALSDAEQRPSYHIVPSATVANFTTTFHKKWLTTPGAKGQQRTDTPMRKFIDRDDQFLERWDLLGL
jgi:hypothetical protein